MNEQRTKWETLKERVEQLFGVVVLLALVIGAITVWTEFPTGSHCVISRPVWGMSDMNVYDDLKKAREIKDNYGLNELVDNGKALQVPDGTKGVTLRLSPGKAGGFIL